MLSLNVIEFHFSQKCRVLLQIIQYFLSSGYILLKHCTLKYKSILNIHSYIHAHIYKYLSIIIQGFE